MYCCTYGSDMGLIVLGSACICYHHGGMEAVIKLVSMLLRFCTLDDLDHDWNCVHYFISYKMCYSDHPLVLLTSLHYLHRVISVLLVQKHPNLRHDVPGTPKPVPGPNLRPRYSSTWRSLQHMSACLFPCTLPSHIVLQHGIYLVCSLTTDYTPCSTMYLSMVPTLFPIAIHDVCHCYYLS